ncbi:MAG: hypothetical protein E7588_02215 [Ruminococcaceae bacterium]|nr:hypothetical protein [Oscillospiraceae bacterium]
MKKANKKYDKCCYYCEYSNAILDGESFLCKKKGVVTPDFSCSAFIFDPLKKDISVRFANTAFDESDFKI